MKRTTTLSTGKIVAFGAVIAVTLLALLPGAWSAAVAQTAGTATATTTTQPTVVVTNEASAQVSTTATTTIQTTGVGDSSSDTLTVTVPAGALPANASVSMGVITNSSSLQRQVPPPAGTSLILPLEITATAADGTPITGNFSAPVTIEIEIPDIGITGNLTMAFWNGAQWVQIPTVVTRNPATGRLTVTATVTHFTVFAILQTDATPTAPAPADTGTGLVEADPGANIALLLIAVVGLAGVAGLGAKFALRRS